MDCKGSVVKYVICWAKTKYPFKDHNEYDLKRSLTYIPQMICTAVLMARKTGILYLRQGTQGIWVICPGNPGGNSSVLTATPCWVGPCFEGEELDSNKTQAVFPYLDKIVQIHGFFPFRDRLSYRNHQNTSAHKGTCGVYICHRY